jgi:hypothetical protein
VERPWGALETKGEITAMKRLLGRLALVLVALSVVLPGMASAQYREFNGKIDKVDANKVIVDNRQGDKVSFNKLAETTVAVAEGAQLPEKREKWEDLKKGDWVSVSWKFVDKPRKAYKVTVMPPKEEAGSDE